MKLSYEQTRELIHQALGRDRWIIDLFDNYAIYSDEASGRTYQVNYLIDENGALTLGEQTEVKREINYVALNFELPTAGEPPTQLLLVPAGEVVNGHDGRNWQNPNPQGVVVNFSARGLDLPIDIEHATQIKAPKGEAAPAMGWVKGMSVAEDGAVWGTVEWNTEGSALLTGKKYRYYSAALRIDTNGNIRGLESVGLTNSPNLDVVALNSQHSPKMEEPMHKKVIAKLGLPEKVTEETVLNAIDTLQGDLQIALNRAKTPSLDDFVPRADYTVALNRATTAEQQVADIEAKKLTTEINSEIDAALQAGKIPPASKDFYIATCRREGGLDQFREFIKTAPVIAGASGLGDQDPNKGSVALNAEETQIAAMFGNSAEDLKKYGGKA